MSITPEQSAAYYEAKGVDRENDDPGFCDGCDLPLWPGDTCGMCVTCCGTDDGHNDNCSPWCEGDHPPAPYAA